MFNLWEIFGMTIFQFLFSANQALSRDLRSFGSENDCSKNPSRQRSIWTMQGPAIVSRQRLSSALLAETHLKIWDSCGTFGSCPSHLPLQHSTRSAAACTSCSYATVQNDNYRRGRGEDRLGRSSLGRASLTFSGRPPNSLPSRLLMAARPSASSLIVTNAKPRG